MEGNGHKTLFAMANETRILQQKLGTLDMGQNATYDEMSEWIGKNTRPGGKGYSHLASARKALLRDRIVFDCEPNVGLTRLNDKQILDAASGSGRKSHRAALQALKLVCAAEFANLTPDQKTRHNTQIGLYGTIALMTKPSSELRLLEATKKRGGLLSTTALFDQFRS